MENRAFLCESCQNRFEMAQQVELDGGYLLPICGLCWNQMSVSERLDHAAIVRKQCSVDKAIDALAELLRAEAENRRNPFGIN